MTKGEDYIVLNLTTIITDHMNRNWTRPQLAKVLGVTPLQIHLYKNGTTKSPKPQVCKAIFDNLSIDGKQCLIDIYNSIEDLEKHLKVS